MVQNAATEILHQNNSKFQKRNKCAEKVENHVEK